MKQDSMRKRHVRWIIAVGILFVFISAASLGQNYLTTDATAQEPVYDEFSYLPIVFGGNGNGNPTPTPTPEPTPNPNDLILIEDSLVERFYYGDDAILCCGWYIAGEFYNQGSQPIWLDKVYFEFFDDDGQFIGFDEAWSGAQGVIEPGESECFGHWVDPALNDTGWGSYTIQPIISEGRLEVFTNYTILENRLTPHVSGRYQRWTLTLQTNTDKYVHVGGRYKVINDSDGKLTFCGAWGSGPVFNPLQPNETDTDYRDIILPPEGYTLERDIFGWYAIY